MSQFNLKFISALLILGLGVTEILVFNEEVFIFVCFFIFFNLISVFAGNSISQSFQEISTDLEKNFLHTSKEAKTAISGLVLSKEQALYSIVRVLIFLKAFRNIALQKGMLSASESFVQNVQSCVFALNAFKTQASKNELFPNPITQTLAINAQSTLKSFYRAEGSTFSAAKAIFAGPYPKQKVGVADRLLSSGLLSSSKTMLA
jgi:hypothetical protein